MLGLSLDIVEAIKSQRKSILVTPSIIFGYLYYISYDIQFLLICIGWIMMLSLFFGFQSSIFFPRISNESGDLLAYHIERNFGFVISFIYEVIIAPLTIIVTYKSLFGEMPLIFVEYIRLFPIVPRIIPEVPSAINDPILLILFCIQISVFTFVAGPVLFLVTMNTIEAVFAPMLSFLADKTVNLAVRIQRK
jgi:hypothetical protein